ncbi:hypothetical protein F4803DRAFT_567888 [Xylaria telfairii]|nr:hypothetical protein F4803DRAFT_567888 [Xylaria telfairii]
MPRKKRANKNRASGQGANGISAPSTAPNLPNQEGPPLSQPSANSIAQNAPVVPQIPAANNTYGAQEVVQPAPGLQAVPYASNSHVVVPQQLRGAISEDQYLRLFRSHIPPPAIPGRVTQTYGDARDYLTNEPQEALTGVSSSLSSPTMQPSRSPVGYPSQRALGLDRDLPRSGPSLVWVSKGQHLGPNPSLSGTVYYIPQSQAAASPSTPGSSGRVRLTRSTARLDHLISEVPDTPTPIGRADRARTGTSQPSNAKKARKFSDRDSNPPTSSSKRGRLIEDITDQEEGETQSQVMVVYTRDPSNDTASRSSSRNLVSGDSSNSFRPNTTNAAPRNSASLLSDPFMGAAPPDNEITDMVPFVAPVVPPVMAPPRRGIIMADNYNVFNPSIMARVAAACENSPYVNTPRAIVVYHQLRMADDLYYSGIWRGRFNANNGYIFEYHNPAPSRPDVPESQRNDRRPLFTRAQMPDGRIIWCSIVNGNVLVPASDEMEDPPAELEYTLDLMRYFYIRVPCFPNLERYAELVAPLHIDRSLGSNYRNEVIVGMAPGSNPATAALRFGTPAEASSTAARAALRYIPSVRYEDPPPAVTESPAATVAPFNVGMASSMSTAPFPPLSTGMVPSATGYSPGYLGAFPGPSMTPSISTAPPPPDDPSMNPSMGWLNQSSSGPFQGPSMASNAPFTLGATFPTTDTHMTQDPTGFDLTNHDEYGDEVPFYPPASPGMSSSANTSAATGSSYPALPSTSQAPGATPTSAVTTTSPYQPSDFIIATATVPTTTPVAPFTNGNMTPAMAEPSTGSMTHQPNPIIDPNTIYIALPGPAASPAPAGVGENVDLIDSNWYLQHWLGSGGNSHRSAGTRINNGGSSSNPIGPTNLGHRQPSSSNIVTGNGQPISYNTITGNGQPISNNTSTGYRQPINNNPVISNGQPTSNNTFPGYGQPIGNNAVTSNGQPTRSYTATGNGQFISNNQFMVNGQPISNNQFMINGQYISNTPFSINGQPMTHYTATGNGQPIGNNPYSVNGQTINNNGFMMNGQPLMHYTATGNGQPINAHRFMINGVEFDCRGPTADDYSDLYTDRESNSDLPSEDLQETSDEETEDGAPVEEIDGVVFKG